MRRSIVILASVLACASTAAEGAERIGRWKIADERDALTDKISHGAVLSDRGSGVAVICHPGTSKPTDVVLLTRSNLGTEPRLVAYRFDDGPVSQRPFTVLGRTATITWDRGGAALASELLTATRLRFRVLNGDQTFWDFEANVSGARPALLRLIELCGPASDIGRRP